MKPRKRLDESTLNECYKMRMDGYSYRLIADKFNLSESHIRETLKAKGYTVPSKSIIHKAPSASFTDEMKQKAEELCKTHTILEIAKLLKCSVRQLRVRGYHKLAVVDYNHQSVFYNKDNKFFKDINTEAKAYYLGFLFADGHTKYEDILKLELANQDKYIIEQFRDLISPNQSIKDRFKKNSHTCILEISSSYIVKDLIRHGLSQSAKTKDLLVIPNSVPKSLLHHFVRGLFDGDGTIKGNNTVNLLAYPKLAEELKQLLFSELGIKVSTYLRSKGKPLKVLYFGKQQDVLCFADYIYRDAHYYLGRKYNRFQKLRLTATVPKLTFNV